MKLRRPNPPTLSAVIARYLAEISPAKKSAHTDRSLARRWLSTRLAARPVDRIRNTDVAALRDGWIVDCKPATVVRRLAFLSHVFTVLRKDWGWPSLVNPVQLCRLPSVADARQRRLYTAIRLNGVPIADCPRSELEWLLRSTQSSELPVLLTLAVETAMRRAELCGLRREHVDLRGATVWLPQTKNGEPRSVPLTPWAQVSLARHLASRPARGAVFTMTPEALTHAFGRACSRARAGYEALCRRHGRRAHPAYFKNLRLHDLRHEATSRLASVFGLHELAKITGHKDTRMLLRYTTRMGGNWRGSSPARHWGGRRRRPSGPVADRLRSAS
ncbi:MAG: site-specific integrase [Azonexus sp.]|jgi:integrase|nr:site-specific integrase [Azonexus sp.]